MKRLGGVLKIFAAIAALLFFPPASISLTAPEARGQLSLAWDEYDSGRCETALGYISEIGAIEGEGAETLLEEALWLRCECLAGVGKFEEAAKLVEESWQAAYSWRDDVWRSVISEWAYSATSNGDYEGAQAVLTRGGRLAEAADYFAGLSAATAYRAELSSAVKVGREGRLTGGGELKFFETAPPASEQGWIRVCPKPQEAFGDGDYCDEWMKSVGEKLSSEGKGAWIRLSAEDFRRAVEFEVSKSGLEADLGRPEAAFTRDGYRWYAELEEERKRAAMEGLGVRGGAKLLVAEAVRSIGLQKELVSWIRAHSDDASISVAGDDLVVKRAATGRVTKFRLTDWTEVFTEDRRSWETLWGEVLEELGRQMRPYRCFCGREMVVRETLVSRWEGLPTVWKGEGLASVLLAYCPNHWMLVTDEALKSWGVGRESAARRAAEQATDTEWELTFGREEQKGREYFVFTGTGASSIARKPGLLLGLMQAMEGKDLGGQTLKVWAPMSDALVLAPSASPDEVGEDGAKLAASMVGERHSWSGPFRYKSTVRLPKSPEGTFRLMSREK